ncbi:MAG: HlyD family type I secretion periplasmic adaptor subunit [Sulfitobacter sp.]|nr:HlyD family type I secretion periplasmic adaptor subunit [Sulfitobacter sp.]
MGESANGTSIFGPVLAGFIAILIFGAGLLLWATQSRISGAVVADGTVRTTRAHQLIQHQTGGIVLSVRVTEGDSTRKGDPLLELDPKSLQAALSSVENRIVSQRARLSAERGRAPLLEFDAATLDLAATRTNGMTPLHHEMQLFEAKKAARAATARHFAERRAQIRTQRKGLSSRKAALAEQLELARRERRDQDDLLSRGLVAARPVNALRREEVRLVGAMGELRATQDAFTAQLRTLTAEEAALDTEVAQRTATALVAAGEEVVALEGRARELRRQIAGLVIRAPAAGIVHALRVETPGAVIRPAEPIMEIVPATGRSRISAHVSPADIDQVYPGQPVKVRLSGLNQRITPELEGLVTQISADTVVIGDGSPPRYRVTVRLPAQQKGDPVLLPGMPAQLFFQTESRSPLAYLIQPLTDYFARALRES